MKHAGVAALLAGVCVALPGGATLFASVRAQTAPYQVAWAMVLQNSYTQAMLQGAENAAKSENVKITTFDTGFTAQKQFRYSGHSGPAQVPGHPCPTERFSRYRTRDQAGDQSRHPGSHPQRTDRAEFDDYRHAIARPGRIGANTPGDVGSSAWANDGKRL